jgi:hypothetical protein
VIGDRVDKATNENEGGVVVAVFPTDNGNFRYAVDMEGYDALQFLAAVERELKNPARDARALA